MFRADLAAARAAWLESHIAAMLSVTPIFTVLGTRSSATLPSPAYIPRRLSVWLRHSTLTWKYTHLHADDLAVALGALPDLWPGLPDDQPHRHLRCCGRRRKFCVTELVTKPCN